MLYDTFDRTGQVEFPYPKPVVFRAATEAVTQLPNMELQKAEELASRIDIKTGMTAFSWGENVSISVLANGPGSAVVSIQSAAKTIFGSATTHGKNRQNVRDIIGKISDLLGEKGEAWIQELGPNPIAQPKQAAEPAPRLIADELEKLADLRDKGALTPDEFAALKARLLGL